MKKRLISFEEFETPNPDNSTSETMLDESFGRYEKLSDDIDQGSAVATTLDSVGDSVNEIPEGTVIPEPMIRALDTALEQLTASIGYRHKAISLEDNESPVGIGAKVKAIAAAVWKKIIEALKRLSEYLAEVIDKIFKTKLASKTRRDAVEKQVTADKAKMHETAKQALAEHTSPQANGSPAMDRPLVWNEWLIDAGFIMPECDSDTVFSILTNLIAAATEVASNASTAFKTTCKIEIEKDAHSVDETTASPHSDHYSYFITPMAALFGLSTPRSCSVELDRPDALSNFPLTAYITLSAERSSIRIKDNKHRDSDYNKITKRIGVLSPEAILSLNKSLRKLDEARDGIEEAYSHFKILMERAASGAHYVDIRMWEKRSVAELVASKKVRQEYYLLVIDQMKEMQSAAYALTKYLTFHGKNVEYFINESLRWYKIKENHEENMRNNA